MRHAVSVRASTLFWAAILTSFYQIGLSSQFNDDILSKPSNDPTESDSSLAKRDWSKSLHSWGKRSWSSLHGGWGKRDTLDYPTADKKAWQSLQGGWGKRSSADEDYILSNLADIIQGDGLVPEYNNYVVDGNNDDEKRAWNSLHSGWGKRSGNRKWGSFKGSWGKREPAWTNLKGIWGKRNDALF